MKQHDERDLLEHPMQPLGKDQRGTVCFKENKIVHFLQHTSSYDLNKLHTMGFDAEEWEQFNQLIGYSLDCYEELDYVRDEVRQAARKLAEVNHSGRSVLLTNLPQEDRATWYRIARAMRGRFDRDYDFLFPTLGDVADMTEREFLWMRNVGRTAAQLIKEEMAKRGLNFSDHASAEA